MRLTSDNKVERFLNLLPPDTAAAFSASVVLLGRAEVDKDIHRVSARTRIDELPVSVFHSVLLNFRVKLLLISEQSVTKINLKYLRMF